MSWDIYITKIIDGKEVELAECGNYTYNVTPMYMKAMGLTLSELDRHNCKEVAEILKKGIKEMEKNPEEYKTLNPENGWGDYKGALNYLKTILKECRKWPSCMLMVT